MRPVCLMGLLLSCLALYAPAHAANLPRKPALGVGLSAVTPELNVP